MQTLDVVYLVVEVFYEAFHALFRKVQLFDIVHNIEEEAICAQGNSVPFAYYASLLAEVVKHQVFPDFSHKLCPFVQTHVLIIQPYSKLNHIALGTDWIRHGIIALRAQC